MRKQRPREGKQLGQGYKGKSRAELGTVMSHPSLPRTDGFPEQVGAPGAGTTAQVPTQAQGRRPEPIPESKGGLSEY